MNPKVNHGLFGAIVQALTPVTESHNRADQAAWTAQDHTNHINSHLQRHLEIKSAAHLLSADRHGGISPVGHDGLKNLHKQADDHMTIAKAHYEKHGHMIPDFENFDDMHDNAKYGHALTLMDHANDHSEGIRHES